MAALNKETSAVRVARLSAFRGPNGSDIDRCDGGAEIGAPPGAAPPPPQPDQPHRPAQLLRLRRPRPQPEEAGAPPVRRGGRRQRAQAALRAPGQGQRRQIGGGHRERGGAADLAVHGGGPVREPAGEGEAPEAAAERRQSSRRPRRGHALPRPLQKRLRPRVDRAQQGDPRPHRCLALRPGACLEQWLPVPVAAAGGRSHGADEAHQHQGSQVQFDRALWPPNVWPQLGQRDCETPPGQAPLNGTLPLLFPKLPIQIYRFLKQTRNFNNKLELDLPGWLFFLYCRIYC